VIAIFKFCSFSFIDREPGACKLYPEIEINNIIFFYELPVGKCIFKGCRFDATFPYQNIIIWSGSGGNRFVGQVRKADYLVPELNIQNGELIGKIFNFLLSAYMYFPLSLLLQLSCYP